MNRTSIHLCGERSLLVEVPANADAHLVARRARILWPGIEDAVPGHDTVLLTWPGASPSMLEVHEMLAMEDQDPAVRIDGTVVIPTRYQGEDLRSVCAETGLSEEAFVALHTGATFTAAFVGFSPGFAYLIGLPERLRVDRLDEPRQRVPAGAVALAGEYSAVYPSASPGGWRLIGETDLVMFDPGGSQPSLIQPGMTVRFEAVRG